MQARVNLHEVFAGATAASATAGEINLDELTDGDASPFSRFSAARAPYALPRSAGRGEEKSSEQLFLVAEIMSPALSSHGRGRQFHAAMCRRNRARQTPLRSIEDMLAGQLTPSGRPGPVRRREGLGVCLDIQRFDTRQQDVTGPEKPRRTATRRSQIGPQSTFVRSSIPSTVSGDRFLVRRNHVALESHGLFIEVN